ncbi:MAG: PepSY domain-containing protein [Rhodopirellula sp. JB055]|uniref:PepSY domain-containing protein n=1 Tax=Rhodopirellula sp. JB055 TaxID=3342846 RepID=UPI00370AC101
MKPLLLTTLIASTILPLGLTGPQIVSGQTAGGTRLSLVKMVQSLEQDGYGPFTEVSMDDGNWEVETQKGNESVELMVDPSSGKVLSEHHDDPDTPPPADAMPLSKLLQTVMENSHTQDIDEVSFERRYWEIEGVRNGQKRELHVDPITAKIIADRIDD